MAYHLGGYYLFKGLELDSQQLKDNQHLKEAEFPVY